ncbi:neuropeptide Y receptor type 5-like [Dermacentor andersoni]|uniref:neuropeptide Y receptor type 5-like n=1 Tax=Dermacentor andersoni TaxID=34620 RepID=UPI00215533AD|nr:G-protein coupled receptor 83-like [Dermacentor andersoni]
MALPVMPLPTVSEALTKGANLSAALGHAATDPTLASGSWAPSEENSTAPSFRLNLTADDYPPMIALGFELQAFLIVLYSLTALLALGGNVMVIVVLVLGRRSSRELRLFLVNLALSDIAMAVFSIPFTYTDFMLGRWIFEPLFCPVVLFMQHVSVIVSVYTLTAIGIDR